MTSTNIKARKNAIMKKVFGFLNGGTPENNDLVCKDPDYSFARWSEVVEDLRPFTLSLTGASGKMAYMLSVDPKNTWCHTPLVSSLMHSNLTPTVGEQIERHTDSLWMVMVKNMPVISRGNFSVVFYVYDEEYLFSLTEMITKAVGLLTLNSPGHVRNTYCVAANVLLGEMGVDEKITVKDSSAPLLTEDEDIHQYDTGASS